MSDDITQSVTNSTTRNTPYNHMSLKRKVQLSMRMLARARKRGAAHVWKLWLKEQPSIYLAPSRRLDGLSLYRQAVTKLQVPPAVYDDRGRTILLVSHCN